MQVTSDYLSLNQGLTVEQVAESVAIYRDAGVFGDLVEPLVGATAVAVGGMLDAPSRQEKVAQLAAITITAQEITSPAFGLLRIDDGLQATGRAATLISEQIESKPWLSSALTALDVASGPVAFVVRQLVEASPLGDGIQAIQQGLYNQVNGRFAEFGYEAEDAVAGGVGAVALGATAMSGAAGAVVAVRGAVARAVAGEKGGNDVNTVTAALREIARDTSNNGKGWTKFSSKTRSYVRDIDLQTSIPLSSNQRVLLANELRFNNHDRLLPDAARNHRLEFNRIRHDLILEWEVNTGRQWPKYENPVFSKKE